MELKNVSTIITGGASGLGFATAEKFVQAGAKVAIFDVNEDVGTASAQKIGASFFKVDATCDAAMISGVNAAEGQNGVARVLVNCAGIGIAVKTVGRDAEYHPLDEFAKVINVNLLGTFNAISKFAANLSKADPIGEERGIIINTASVAAFDGQIGQAAYSASKGGVVGMTLPIARDLSRYGIRVCTIAPGIFWTPMLDGLSEEAKKSLHAQVPFPSRLGQPSEYATLAESIVVNPMLNGETIRLDGAIRMAPK